MPWSDWRGNSLIPHIGELFGKSEQLVFCYGVKMMVLASGSSSPCWSFSATHDWAISSSCW